MKMWIDDLRHARRGLLAHRGSFGLAAAVLAGGLGLAIAMACVIDAVLLRPLPLPHGERLVQVRELTAAGHAINLALPNHDDLAQAVDAFAATTFYAAGAATVATPERAISAMTTHVGGDFFGVLGEGPAQGRAWAPGTHDHAAVISHGLWQGLLQGDPAVIGRRLSISGVERTVIGVMPAGFGFPFDSAAWIPADPSRFGSSRTAHNWHMLGLLHSTAELPAARQQAQALATRLVAEYGDDLTARGFDLLPLAESVAAPVRSALLVLGGGVGFLLLIAVSTALNLMMSLGLARSREFAVRAALGASRWRLLRQRSAEHLALAATAWLGGLLIAQLSIGALVALAGRSLPRSGEVALTPGLLGASIALALAIAALLSLASWVGLRRAAPAAALREGGRGQSASPATQRTQTGLLVAQTALATVLLVGAILVGRSFLALLAIDPGYDEQGAVRIELIQPRPSGSEAAFAAARRYQDLIEGISTLPGVSAVGGVDRLPLTGGGNGMFWDHRFTRFDRPPPPPLGSAEFRVASAGYFDAAAIPLLRGRLFAASDRPDGEHVALISQTVARQTWGTADPIGQRIQFGNMDGDPTLLTVVGVVGDVHESRLDRSPAGTVYVHLAQRPIAAAQLNLVVRSSLPLPAILPLLRDHLERNAADVPHSLQPLAEVRRGTLTQRRFNLVLLASFAAAALLLAGTGLYGLVAYSVGQRSGEFAVRQALGATAADICRLVLRGGLAVSVLGVTLGLGLALGASRLLASLLFGVPVSDPASYALVVAMLLGVAALACMLPALRAARMPPSATLH